MRFWFEAGLALVCGSLTLLTLFVRDWVEAFTGFDPDHGSGSFEWTLVVGLALASVVVGLAARREWRRSRTTVFGSA